MSMDHGSGTQGPDRAEGAVPAKYRTEALDVRGLQFASEKAVVDSTLGRLPGVVTVDANPVAQGSSSPLSVWSFAPRSRPSRCRAPASSWP